MVYIGIMENRVKTNIMVYIGVWPCHTRHHQRTGVNSDPDAIASCLSTLDTHGPAHDPFCPMHVHAVRNPSPRNCRCIRGYRYTTCPCWPENFDKAPVSCPEPWNLNPKPYYPSNADVGGRTLLMPSYTRSLNSASNFLSI